MKFLERAFDKQNQIWKYLIVIFGGLFGGQLIGSIPLLCVTIYKTVTSSGGITLNPENIADFTVLGISKNLAFFLTMLAPLASLITTIILIKLLHKRTFSETVNGTKKIRISRCLSGAAVWLILMAIYLLVDNFFNPKDYILQFNLVKFIPLLLISLIFIPFQTTSEEFLFRGYLAQGVAKWTKNRWLAILIPGLLFGLIHAYNPEVSKFGFWIAMPQYIFIGLLFGVFAVLDDGIELPMGAHAANNFFLSIFTTNSSSVLQTDAVFVQQNINPVKDNIVVMAIGVIAFTYFFMKYKWNFKILNKKVQQIEQNNNENEY
jgi:membrane protease YdiL (CAAX protease family)